MLYTDIVKWNMETRFVNKSLTVLVQRNDVGQYCEEILTQAMNIWPDCSWNSWMTAEAHANSPSLM